MGHWISFCITLTLMLGLFVFILRQAASGHRRFKPRFHRWGPICLLGLAIPLIMSDLIRHLIQDNGGWQECGNNNLYPRINSTDPYPPACAWSSNQYKCTKLCCVPTWNNDSWGSPQTTFFPTTKWDHGRIVKDDDDDAAFPDQFAVQFPNSSHLQFPEGFDQTEQPWRVFQTPLVLDGTGTVNIAAAANGGEPLYPRGDCKRAYSPKGAGPQDGVNPETGYCWLTDQNLPYEQQLAQLDDSSCNCDACLPVSQETMGHLSDVGIVFTICLTYCGFGLLATAVMWNAEIVSKFKKIGRQWKELRAEQRRRKLAAASAMGA